MGLVVIIVMGATGFFSPPQSEVTDKNTYQATGSRQTDKKSNLHFIDVDFSTPTQPQQPEATPPQGTTVTPTTPYVEPPNACKINQQMTASCVCNVPPHAHWVYCKGKLPGNPMPDCMVPFGGDTTYCDAMAKLDPTCVHYCMGKPVIYLYVEKPTYVDVTLGSPQTLVESIPSYDNGWKNILAMPGGVLLYKNNYYRELYYESSHSHIEKPDNGVFLDSDNLQQGLTFETQRLGLNALESEEFVRYWLPRLHALNKPYIFFSIISKEEKERTDHVEISPKPDVFIQFIAYFEGVDDKFTTKPFIYPTLPNRHGFTAIEWGGVIGK